MKYEAVKCPSCGAQLQLDDSQATGFCMYCGNKFLVQDAIQRMKIELSGHVSMSGISTVENDIMLGKQCLEAKDWKKAFSNFQSAVSKQAENFDAWHGCLISLTQNFSGFDYDWPEREGVYGIDSVLRNINKYGNKEQREQVKRNMTSLLTSMQIKESNDFNLKLAQYKLDRKRVKNAILFLIFSALAIGLLASRFDKVSFLWDGTTIALAFTLPIISLILLIRALIKGTTIGAKNEDDLHDKALIRYIQMIEGLLG